MSNINQQLQQSLEQLVLQAEKLGRNKARHQMLDLCQSLLDNPRLDEMNNLEVIRWLVDALKMEHDVDM